MNGHNIVSSICVRDDKKYPLLATTHLASDKSKSLKRIKVFNTFIRPGANSIIMLQAPPTTQSATNHSRRNF